MSDGPTAQAGFDAGGPCDGRKWPEDEADAQVESAPLLPALRAATVRLPRSKPEQPAWAAMAGDALWSSLVTARRQGGAAVCCLLVRDQRWTARPETRLVLDGDGAGREQAHSDIVSQPLYDQYARVPPEQRTPLLTAVRRSVLNPWSSGAVFSIRRGDAGGEEVAVGVRDGDDFTLRSVGMDGDAGSERELCFVSFKRAGRQAARSTLLVLPEQPAQRDLNLQDALAASSSGDPHSGVHVLRSKEPIWAEGKWVMNFGARAREASERNLIVPPPDAQEGTAHAVLLGRLSRYSWALDFAYPACALQAFFVALCAFELPH